MKSTKRVPWVLLALLALVALVVSLLRRQAAILERASSESKQPSSSSYRQTPFWRIYDQLAERLDAAVGWDKVPLPVGLLILIGLRNILRQQNLYDTTHEPAVNQPAIEPMQARYLTERTSDGTHNDLNNPAMGMAGSRFGRNVPIEYTFPEPKPAILTPNPRTVSLELLTREKFLPATTLNILAATWIQFMVRDWFSHGTSPKDNPWQIELHDDDPWPDHPMNILRVPSDPTRTSGSSNLPPTYINTETHWWDASQIYGSNKAQETLRRCGQDGKLRIGSNGLLQLPSDPNLNPALVPGWWLGLEMMETLFTLEHNAICDRLRAEYPTWSDDDIFARARLVNAALMAKIHTVEWTPAIISHPTSQFALKANWWGIEMEELNKLFGRLSSSEVISGIPGSETDHFGVPYCLTEEFTIVYRMHPLIPDDYSFRSTANDVPLQNLTLGEMTGPHAEEVLQRISMTDIFYSFGTAHPGAIVLNNYPRFLQKFERPDGYFMDLAATDILRTRELGVPRYNQFRKLLHLPPASSFEELAGDPALAEKMRHVYNNDIDRVDLIVGMFAEKRPQGFAFSETAFRIFIVMASRRLNSDRFLTNDFNAKVYTQAGMDWIRDNTMSTVLLRHYPQLRSSLRGVDNAFTPWVKANV
ncbi:MAG TPA: heme peroxidase [Ktedonobacter sp.]|nr:heme peroxidase [Ktedonobacter sp.]